MSRLHQLFPLMFLFFFCCKSTQYTPADFPEKRVIFGSGGGFTGDVTEFTLLENGQIFKRKGMSEHYEEMKAISKKEAKKVFKEMKRLEIDTIQHDKPGNFYHYVHIKKDSLDHVITWGGVNPAIPDKLKVFYDTLNHVIKDRPLKKEASKK